MSNKPAQTTVPNLRFPEFSGNWEEKQLGDVFSERNEKGFSNLQLLAVTTSTGVVKASSLSRGSNTPSNKESYKRLCIGDIAYNTMRMWQGASGVSAYEGIISPAYTVIVPNDRNVSEFWGQYFKCRSVIKIFERHSQGLVPDTWSIKYPAFSSIKLFAPHPDEQAKIAAFLETVDELIAAEVQKLEALKDHKKGLMQQLFPAEGKTLPNLRFPEFRNAPEWKEQPLKKFLDFQQPTAYLVSDPKYSNAYETPVLTAGKTFILGYTNEQGGIFKDNLPVIIFDDFTTATQFVDFPFKAKSSAMKILHAKNGANIKFMYEAMQMISYEVGVHARHWISKFAPMLVPIPIDLKEQQKIADCLSSMDDLITAQSKKVKLLQDHKKGLMQQLFPQPDEEVMG